MVVDRVLGLALLTSGLRAELRNSMAAVHAFLNAKPLEPGLEERNLEELKSHSRWRQVYAHTQKHLGQLVERVKQIPTDTKASKVDWAKLVTAELDKRAQSLGDERIDVENGLEGAELVVDGNGGVSEKIVELAVESMISGLLPREGLLISHPADAADAGALELKFLRRGTRLTHTAFQSVFDPFTVADEDIEAQGLRLLSLYLLVYHLGGTIQFSDLGEDSTELLLSIPRETPPEGEDWEQSLMDNLLNENVWELLPSQ